MYELNFDGNKFGNIFIMCYICSTNFVQKMKTQSITRQDLWLLDTILRAGKISFEEINQHWLSTEMSGGVEISHSTFMRHRNTIQETFGIFIDCDRKDGFRYSVSNPEDLQESSILRWLISSFSTSSLLVENGDLKSQIVLEDIRGQFYLEKILQAMRNRQMLRMTYTRFGMKDSSIIEVEPYCVKLHHQRWYVIVRNPKSRHSNLTTYALDRINELDIIMDSHYDLPKDFSASDFFKNYFGVYVDDKILPEHAVIRAYGTQADYLRSLPLHSSQTELSTVIETTEPYTDFAYLLAITDDFINELLSKNDKIEVLQPASLRQKMREEIERMCKRYQEK